MSSRAWAKWSGPLQRSTTTRQLRSSNTSPDDLEGLSQRRRLHDDSQLSSTKIACRSTTKSRWTRSYVQYIPGPKTKNRMSSRWKSERLEVDYRRQKGRTKINCYMKENQSQFSETRWLKDVVKKHSELGTRRRAALHVVRHWLHQRRR